MKLSRLEMRILKFIRKEYPHVYDAPEAKEIKTAEERPLATEGTVATAFGAESESVRKALIRLKAYRCIESIYLFEPDEFSEHTMSPGKKIRMTPMVAPKGKDGYQVTAFGIQTIESTVWEKLKRTAITAVSKFFEERLALLIFFILGMLVSSFFGLDIRKG